MSNGVEIKSVVLTFEKFVLICCKWRGLKFKVCLLVTQSAEQTRIRWDKNIVTQKYDRNISMSTEGPIRIFLLRDDIRLYTFKNL